MQRLADPPVATRLATLAVAATLLLPIAARGQTASAADAPDCVIRNAREPICGRLELLDPDRRSLTIRTPDGATRRLGWHEIVTAWGPSFPMRRTGRDAAVPFPGTVHVELVSTGAPQTLDLAWADPVPLSDEARARSAGVLRRASCTTPCTLRLAPGAVSARFSGNDVAPRPIVLSIPTSDVRIRLRAHSGDRARVAEVLAVIGSSMMLGGLILPLAVVATGNPPMPPLEPWFWGSLGVSMAGILPSTAGIALDPLTGVEQMERLCRAPPPATPAPWSQPARQPASSSALLPAPPTETRFVPCR